MSEMTDVNELLKGARAYVDEHPLTSAFVTPLAGALESEHAEVVRLDEWNRVKTDELEAAHAEVERLREALAETTKLMGESNDLLVLRNRESAARADHLTAQLQAVRARLEAPYPGNPIPEGSRIGPYCWATAVAEARAIILDAAADGGKS